MAVENVGLNELKEKRMNLLIALGEETHSAIRRQEVQNSEKMKNISNEIKQVDIQISTLTHSNDIGACPKCQAQLEAEAMFCKQCGFAVKEYYAAYVSKCSCCGSPMKAEQRFCGSCGTMKSKENDLEKVEA